MPVTAKQKRGAKGAAKKPEKSVKTVATKKTRVTAIKEAYTKSQLINELILMSGLEKKEVLSVLDGLTTIMPAVLSERLSPHG